MLSVKLETSELALTRKMNKTKRSVHQRTPAFDLLIICLIGFRLFRFGSIVPVSQVTGPTGSRTIAFIVNRTIKPG
jgi:hypothetical protein